MAGPRGFWSLLKQNLQSGRLGLSALWFWPGVTNVKFQDPKGEMQETQQQRPSPELELGRAWEKERRMRQNQQGPNFGLGPW